jgi:hypothetical protein
LQISQPTINRDITYLRQQARENIKKYIDERLPEEYEKCLVGLNAITKEAWNTANNTEDKQEKIHALSLAKECYSMKLDLLTNASVVDDAIRFVSQKSKEMVKSAFGIVVTQWVDGMVQILYAEEFHRPDYNEMLSTVYSLMSKYDIDMVYVDGANPSFIKSLKLQIGEDPDYDKVIARYKSEGLGDATKDMKIVPVNFNKEHKSI